MSMSPSQIVNDPGEERWACTSKFVSVVDADRYDGSQVPFSGVLLRRALASGGFDRHLAWNKIHFSVQVYACGTV